MTKDPFRVIFISRIDFVPEILEMIRFNLLSRTEQNISLIYHPYNEELQTERNIANSYLLIENGFEDRLDLEDFEPVEMALQLAWVVVMRNRLFNLVNRLDYNLESFGQALVEIKLSSPHTYPWFEALYSKDTFYNLNLLLSTQNTDSTDDSSFFWQQKEPSRILCKAIEQRLLNPLSVEADQALATNVFLASDSVCFTSWVPIEFLADKKAVSVFFPDSVIVPFPDFRGAGSVPVISFTLWQRRSIEKIKYKDKPRKDLTGFRFSGQSLQTFMDWVNNSFNDAYDRLIMGEL